jgi:hypothetical protein
MWNHSILIIDSPCRWCLPKTLNQSNKTKEKKEIRGVSRRESKTYISGESMGESRRVGGERAVERESVGERERDTFSFTVINIPHKEIHYSQK